MKSWKDAGKMDFRRREVVLRSDMRLGWRRFGTPNRAAKKPGLSVAERPRGR
ncbi:MAG: hypothetical protein HY751_06005 [Nitrospinae bacterium]|nr:hypothetical protein [Nitrospinota bacterium]